MPWRTLTPDAVVVPLQYAVAVKRILEPASGARSLKLRTSRKGRESRMFASKKKANPNIATRVTKTFRQADLVNSMGSGLGPRRSARRRQRGDLHYSDPRGGRQKLQGPYPLPV